MLFFRSEERVDEWCETHHVAKRPLVRLDQLWEMATTWYATRLTLEARRPQPEEIRGIFASIGLTDPFWDPLADAF